VTGPTLHNALRGEACYELLEPELGEAKQGGKAVLDQSFPPLIFANISPRSVGGESLFDSGETVTAETVRAYDSEQSATEEAVRVLTEAGFQVLDVSPISINIALRASSMKASSGLPW